MNTQHGSTDLKTFQKGANSDDSEEILGATETGEYVHAHNLRHDEGQGQVLSKVKGETIHYPLIENSCVLNSGVPITADYECMVQQKFAFDGQAHIVEILADRNHVADPIIRIDGIIVLRTPVFPIDSDYKIQWDVDESCLGGELFITDNHVRPMIFNLKDLMVNGGVTPDESGTFICTQKYFADFNLDLFILQPQGDNNHPIWLSPGVQRVCPTGAIQFGSGGLDVGLIQIQYRKGNQAGDRTLWCAPTPLLPVPLNYSTESSHYRNNKTYGATAGTLSPYGCHFRFRIDNLANFEFIEFKITKFVNADGLGSAGLQKLIDYKLPITAGDIYIQDMFYAGGLELDIATDDAEDSVGDVTRAKAIRYHNQRLYLFNVEFGEQSITQNITFKEVNGKKMYPCIQNLGVEGHKNPYNFAYSRALQSGEKYGWAVMGRDANNSPTFATPIPNSTSGENYQNYQMPNRRKPISAETAALALANSQTPTKAANVNGVASNIGTSGGNTHEVFDTNACYGKGGNNDVNIMTDAGFGAVHDYLPMTPTSQNDGDVTDHDFLINTQYWDGAAWVSGGNQAFGITYNAIGMALEGVGNLPSNIKSFSVIRTKRANRVIAQGLSFYKMPQDNHAGLPTATWRQDKSLNSIYFQTPDTALIADVMADISANGAASRYKIQCVSPLGFFSEIYATYNDIVGGVTILTDFFAMDMCCYARILKENPALPINVGDSPSNDGTSTGMGIDATPPDGKGYTAYSKWRTRQAPGAIGGTFPVCANGEQLFDITGMVNVQGFIASRVPIIEITTTQPIYLSAQNQPAALITARQFNDATTQNWHEPVYVVNIVDTLADVPQPNILEYFDGGHYQKVEARLGITTGIAQTFLLVDERSQDCTAQSTLSGTIDRVLFIQNKNGGIDCWLDINNKVAATEAAAILAGTRTTVFNGVTYQVKGMYKGISTAAGNFPYAVSFNNSYNPNSAVYPSTLFVPSSGSYVIVRYNNSVPIQAYVGDSTTHEHVWSPYDTKMSSTIGSGQSLGVGNHNMYLAGAFPYEKWRMPPSYNFPLDVGNSAGVIQYQDSTLDFQMSGPRGGGNIIGTSLRQMILMYSCESRASLPYEFEQNVLGAVTEDRYFPATNYIIRPLYYDPAFTAGGQPWPAHGKYANDADADYPSEAEVWCYGGFRFLPQINIDYQKEEENFPSFSAPLVGFTEQTDFCTRGIWTAQRPTNVIDAPGLRVFPALNFYDVSDDTGEIKLAYDEYTDAKGQNLYVFTETGTCLLITDKTLLYDATGNSLAAVGNSGANIILQQIWLSKKIGMNDETWRSKAEGFHVVGTEEGGFRKLDALHWVNKQSSYKLTGNLIVDTARDGKYHYELYHNLIKNIAPGYATRLTGYYDTLNDEYHVIASNIEGDRGTNIMSHLWDEKTKKFLGTTDFNYDKCISFENLSYGYRAGTFKMDSGSYILNGSNITVILDEASAKSQYAAKEFIRMRCNSNIRPDKVDFFNNKISYLSGVPDATIDLIANPLLLRDYNGFEGYVPRQTVNKERMQGRAMIYRITETSNTQFILVDVGIMFKILGENQQKR